MASLQPEPHTAPADAVTELGTRTRLLEDLCSLRSAEDGAGEYAIAAFRLTGLDGYERRLGSQATCEMLHVLARRLSEVLGSGGVAYRVGHARFAALVQGSGGTVDAYAAGCLEALSEGCDDARVEGGVLIAMTPIADILLHDELLLLGPAALELEHA